MNNKILVGWIIAIAIGSLIGSYVCYVMCEPCKEITAEIVRPASTPRTINKYVFIKDEPPAWPTPYPEGRMATNISQEGCEEHRFDSEKFTTEFGHWWEGETHDDTTNTYELIKFLEIAIQNTVASHNCYLYDPTFDDDHFSWAGITYYALDILDRRFYGERH